MSGKKKVLMVLIILLLFASVAAGLMWHMNHYVMVDFKFYPKDAQSLNLQGQEISVRHYKKITRRLPNCDIAWDVPLSDGRYPEDSKEITITTLTDSDVELLDYLTELKTIQAKGCTNYWQLLALRNRRPEVELIYNVALGNSDYPGDATKIDVKDITAEEISLLACLPDLQTVICSRGQEDVIGQLQEYCHSKALNFCIRVGGKEISDSAKSVSASSVTEEELTLLQFPTDMEQLHIQAPKASAESLLQLKTSRPDVDISWEAEICGELHSTQEEEIDLSKAEVKSIDQVKAAMAYFPDAKTVFLGKCGIDNDELAAYREEMRADYKVVWTVELGKKLTARTDDTTFMPVREGVYYFNDEEAYNLRYCEDMLCIDIGHMSISDISFVEYMPELQYLILAHTQVQYIKPISSCKKLKFLELDNSPLKDYSPLVGCTALEDLNLGNTYADFEPIGKMTWLKNLWMIGCSRGPAYRMTQALTETKVMISGSATVANGWRDLENYYAMRDLLGMEYMTW